MNLFNHQLKLLAKNPARHLVAWGTGTGKTIMAISLASKNCESVLVVCPKALKENWRRNMLEHANSELVWAVLTKEEFKKQWNSIVGYEGVIWDEAHALVLRAPAPGDGDSLGGEGHGLGLRSLHDRGPVRAHALRVPARCELDRARELHQRAGSHLGHAGRPPFRGHGRALVRRHRSVGRHPLLRQRRLVGASRRGGQHHGLVCRARARGRDVHRDEHDLQRHRGFGAAPESFDG